MSAGYSGTPLVKKLGIKPGMRVLLEGAPQGYIGGTLTDLPEELTVLKRAGADMDFIQVFVRDEGRLRRRFAALKGRLRAAGMLWVSWPKKSSDLFAGMTENDVRRIGLAEGLVDVKVCAVDADWSGLKFVRRTADR